MAEKTDLKEELFQSIDTIVQARIANLPYDKTVECEVLALTDASQAKYQVQYQNATFDAYSQGVLYNPGDIVYVSIPENDFTKNKIIVQKKRIEKITPFRGLSFTHLLYNPTNYYDKTLTAYITTQPLSQTGGLFVKANEIRFDPPIAGYTKLGLKCAINSNITAQMKSGDYGIQLIITGYDLTKITGEITSQENTESKTFWLKMEDMIGVNLYNTFGFITQQKVFDINNFIITKIEVYLWEDGNFETLSGQQVTDKRIAFKDIQIYFGYEKSLYPQTDYPYLVLYIDEQGLNYFNSISTTFKFKVRMFTRPKENPDILEENIAFLDPAQRNNYPYNYYIYQSGGSTKPNNILENFQLLTNYSKTSATQYPYEISIASSNKVTSRQYASFYFTLERVENGILTQRGYYSNEVKIYNNDYIATDESITESINLINNQIALLQSQINSILEQL